MTILGTVLKVADIRKAFQNESPNETGNLEIINATFIADEATIFGTVNEDWNNRELAWYLSQSLSIRDIPPPVPTIWQEIASVKDTINSNYGWCIYSADNGYQYNSAVSTLIHDKNTRQAVMIYNRPTMHVDSKKYGMKDFMCTNTVQLYIRDNMLHYIVYMRSNDAVYGYKGDRSWHEYVFTQAFTQLSTHYSGLRRGMMIWNAASLHVYPRHFDLIKQTEDTVAVPATAEVVEEVVKKTRTRKKKTAV
jgi:thymidylate synthase